MAVTRRRKLAIISLAIYWPSLFVLAHIPVPDVVRKAGVSDKALHFLAYLTLVFLFWIALNPESRVRWRKAAVWWALLTVVAYGIIDELLQGYVGRSCDVEDFGADLAGAFTGFILLTLFAFWPAAVVVGGAIIFGLTNITRTSLSELQPVINAMFHLFGYAVFTLVWVRCMVRPQVRRLGSLGASNCKWLTAALGLPVVLLLAVKGCSIWLGREFPILDVILAVAGIVAAVGIAGRAVLIRQPKTQESSGDD